MHLRSELVLGRRFQPVYVACIDYVMPLQISIDPMALAFDCWQIVKGLFKAWLESSKSISLYMDGDGLTFVISLSLYFLPDSAVVAGCL